MQYVVRQFGNLWVVGTYIRDRFSDHKWKPIKDFSNPADANAYAELINAISNPAEEG
jgi:hypothetical protein